jgi:hypothetical protein
MSEMESLTGSTLKVTSPLIKYLTGLIVVGKMCYFHIEIMETGRLYSELGQIDPSEIVFYLLRTYYSLIILILSTSLAHMSFLVKKEQNLVGLSFSRPLCSHGAKRHHHFKFYVLQYLFYFI